MSKIVSKILLPLFLILSLTACKNAVQTHIDLANTYYDQGKWEQSVQECTLVINQATDLSDLIKAAHITRAAAYAEQGKYTEAIKDCTTIIEKDTDNTMAYYQRSIVYIKNGNYSEAIDDCNKAISLGMDNNLVRFNRGVAYFKKGQNDLALIDLNEAKKTTPSGPILDQINIIIQQIGSTQK